MTDHHEERWTVTRAIQEAEKAGVKISRPSVIKLCREQGAGYQIMGNWTQWYIYPDKFMSIILGENYARKKTQDPS